MPTQKNNPPPIIGLTGAAGAGKDTVRAMLEELYGYTGIAFADPMRDMVRSLFASAGIPAAYATNRDLKETAIPGLGTSYRHIMQTIGTEWGRVTIPGIWIRLARARLQNMAKHTIHPLNIVISDVRFADEAAWVKANGGTIWRVVRPSAEPVRAHISEGMLPASLSLTYGDDFRFTLTDSMAIKNLEMLDGASSAYADKEGGFDADVAIFTGELSKMIPALIKALGGEQQQ